MVYSHRVYPGVCEMSGRSLYSTAFVHSSMTKPIRAVIFDLDGVLADSEPGWNEIDAQLRAEYGANYKGEYHREVLGVSYPIAVEFYKKAFGINAPTEKM